MLHMAIYILLLFDFIIYIPVKFFSVISGWVFLCWTRTKQGSMCLAQGHTTVRPARLDPEFTYYIYTSRWSFYLRTGLVHWAFNAVYCIENKSVFLRIKYSYTKHILVLFCIVHTFGIKMPVHMNVWFSQDHIDYINSVPANKTNVLGT